MYNRVLDSLPTEFADLPPDSEGAEAAEGLSEEYNIIVGKSALQSGFKGTAQEGTAQRTVARQNIREYMSTLARTGRSIARKKPGFEQNFPPPSDKNDVELLTDARAVAVKAMEYKTDFTGRGLKVEYLQSINNYIADFDNSLDATNSAVGLGGAAVGGKNAAYDRADEHFDVLDDFIRNFYRDQPEKLAAWKIVSHIRRSTGNDDEPNTPAT